MTTAEARIPPALSVLVPAYNEEVGLEAGVRQVHAKLASLEIGFEILVVDDGSTDQTGAIADRLAASIDQVRVIHHYENRNIGGGMISGIQEARGEWLILIPADLPLDLKDLEKYLEASKNGDVVVGVSTGRGDYTPFRKFYSWLNIRLIQLLFRMPFRQYNFISLYRLSVLRLFEIRYWRSAFFFAEILIRARDLGVQMTEVDIRYQPRVSGKATGSNLRLIFRTGRDMLHFYFSRLRSRK